MKKNNDSKIYSRLDYNSAVLIKRNILSMEMNLLNISQIMKEFRDLRNQEYSLKIASRNNLEEAKKHISVIIDNSPKTDNLKKLKKEKESNDAQKEKNSVEKKQPKINSIERELLDIQERLSRIS